MAKLAIIGTGFVGTSLGLALKPSKLFDTVAGFDVDRARTREAARLGAIDDEARSVPAAVKDAAVVIVTTPGDELGDLFEAMAPALSAGAVVSETSRWKARSLEAATALPAEVHFVAGRPVLDRAGHGPAEARADVFRGAVYCLTPAADADPSAIEAMSAVVAAAGAQEYFLSPQEHDGLTAGGELLPTAMIVAGVLALTRDGAWRETGRLAADTLSQFAAAAEEMDGFYWYEAAGNQEALGRWLDAAIDQLAGLRADLAAADGDALRKAWEATKEDLARWRRDKRQLVDATMPSKAELRPNLLGSLTGFNKLRQKTTPPSP